MTRMIRTVDGIDPTDTMKRLVEIGLRPHLRRIKQIEARGRLPVAVFEPPRKIRPLILQMGWNGGDHVFGMPSAIRWAFAASLLHDPVGKAWVESSRHGRILVMAQGGTLLINISGKGEFSIEPGSLDSEVFNG